MPIKIYASELLALNEFIFSGGEVQVKIIDKYVSPHAYIEADIHSSDDIMKLLMYTNALREIGAKQIDLIMPYIPYARQDRICAPGEALSIRVFANLINAQNYNSVLVWDAHSNVAPALIHNCVNVSCTRFVADAIAHIKKPNHIVLVAPDAGATKKVQDACKGTVSWFLQASKIRDPSTGEITGTEIQGDVYAHQHYLIVDDICDGGRTFTELARKLREEGADHVDLYVTHGIFSKGFAVFDNLIEHIYCANPWPIFFPNENSNRHKVS